MAGSPIQRVERGAVYDTLQNLLRRVSQQEEAVSALKAITLNNSDAINANGQPIQFVRDPLYGQDAVNLRTLYRYVNNQFAILRSQLDAAEGGDLSNEFGIIGAGSAPPTVALPDLLAEVVAYADANPVDFANSCIDSGGTWDFMDGLVAYLRGIDERVGFNGKRGDVNDPSEDALSYYHGILPPIEGSNDVYVVDVIARSCSPEQAPAWQNVTTSAAAGAWLSVRP